MSREFEYQKDEQAGADIVDDNFYFISPGDL